MSRLVENGNLVSVHHVGCDFASDTLAVCVDGIDDDTACGLASLVRDVNTNDWVVHLGCLSSSRYAPILS